MEFESWDAVEVCLAEFVLEDQMPARMAVVCSCRAHLSTRVQYLSLALASLTATLEAEWLSGTLLQQSSLLEVYRTGVALTADIAVLELTAPQGLCCADLLNHWAKTNDTFFFTDRTP